MMNSFTKIAACALMLLSLTAKAQFKPADPWLKVKNILKLIKAPSFPNKDFNIKAYGAVADGTTNCSKAIKLAIEACNAAGGGRVIVPAGK